MVKQLLTTVKWLSLASFSHSSLSLTHLSQMAILLKERRFLTYRLRSQTALNCVSLWCQSRWRWQWQGSKDRGQIGTHRCPFGTGCSFGPFPFAEGQRLWRCWCQLRQSQIELASSKLICHIQWLVDGSLEEKGTKMSVCTGERSTRAVKGKTANLISIDSRARVHAEWASKCVPF